jgi:hypothetical protein
VDAERELFNDEQLNKENAMRFMLGLAVGLVLLTGCQPAEQKSATENEDKPAAPAQSPVERGKYLTTVGGCNDCHTPKTFGPNGPEADMTKELSGHPAGDKIPAVPAKLNFGEGGFGTLTNTHLTAWIGPWGISYAMNLTPIKRPVLEAGRSRCLSTPFATESIREQDAPSSPPMPWNWYRNMTDDDLKGVFAYLQSLPPINNAIPDPTPPDKLPR